MSEALSLQSKLDLSAVAGLYSDLMDRKEQDIVLDLAEVTHVGTLCLQVIIAAARHAKSIGNSLDLRNANDRVVEQMRVLGTTPETIMEGLQ